MSQDNQVLSAVTDLANKVDSQDRELRTIRAELAEANSGIAEIKNVAYDIREVVNAISEKIDKVLDKLENIENDILVKLEKKMDNYFIKHTKKLDLVQKSIDRVQETVDEVKRYLRESELEIKATGSDFEGAIKSLGVLSESDADGHIQYKKHDFDEVLRADHFIASNIFRISESNGESLKKEKLKNVFRNLDQSKLISVDKIAARVRGMSQKDLDAIKEIRNTSLRQITEQTAMRMRNAVLKEVTKTKRPLEKHEINKIYKKTVLELKSNGWLGDNDNNNNGVNETSERIAQNAMILLNEGREAFMSQNRHDFESDIENIGRAMQRDNRRVVKEAGLFSGLGKKLSLSSSPGEKLEYDPNSMKSLVSAKNIKYLVRAAGVNLVYERTKKVFGDQVSQELQKMSKSMNDRQKLLTSLNEYLFNNEGEPGSPPDWMMDQARSYFNDLKGHYNNNSYESKFIVKRAFDIAVAKKHPEYHRHQGAETVTQEEKDMADMVIAGCCVLDCKEALAYVNGEMDPKRQEIRASYLHEMEESGLMGKVISQIRPELPQRNRHQTMSLH